MGKLLGIALLLAVAGCAPVRPYQRELLSLPTMGFDGDAAYQHVVESREGSTGGYGAVGTGCGCN